VFLKLMAFLMHCRKELVQANKHVFSRESFESDIAILTSKVHHLHCCSATKPFPYYGF